MDAEPDWLASLDEDRQRELREVESVTSGPQLFHIPRWQSVSPTHELLMQVLRDLRRNRESIDECR